MKNFLIFVLGMVFGIIFLFASIIGGGWYVVAIYTPADVVTDQEIQNMLGEFADMSFYDIYKELEGIYNSPDLQSYTFVELKEDYDIDIETILGMDLSDRILAMPVFSVVANPMSVGEHLAVGEILNFVEFDLTSILGNGTVAQFDTITINQLLADPLGVMQDIVTLGGLLSYNTVPITDDIDNYTTVLQDEEQKNIVMSKTPTTAPVSTSEAELGYIMIFQNMWVKAELECMDKDAHTGDTAHTIDCYHPIWVDEYNQPVNGLYTNLSSKTLGQLMNSTDIVGTLLEGLTVGDLGDIITLEGTPLANLGDVNIEDIALELTSMPLGTLLGRPIVVEDISTYTTDVIADQVKSTADGQHFVKWHDNSWCKAELMCLEDTHTDDTHTADCYAVQWEKQGSTEGEYIPLESLEAMLANITVGDLSTGTNDVVEQLLGSMTVGDLAEFGVAIEGTMLEGMSDVSITELTTSLNDIAIGTLLGRPIVVEDISTYTTDVIADQVKSTADGQHFVKWYDNSWCKAELMCLEDTHTDDTHTADCYAVQWEKQGSTEGEYIPLESLEAMLANITVGDLSTGTNDVVEQLLGSMTVGDLAEFGVDIEGTMLEGMSDVNITELTTKLDTMTIGELLGYDKVLIDPTCHHTDTEHTDDCYKWVETVTPINPGDPTTKDVTGINAKLAFLTINDINDPTAVNDIVNELTLRDVLGNIDNAMLENLADTPIGELSTDINSMTIGELMGYTYDQDTSSWYNGEVLDTNKVTGIEAKLADKTINWLQGKDEEGLPDPNAGISNLVSELTLRDVLAEEDLQSGIFAKLADSTIDNLANDVNNMQLGDLLGYTYDQDTSSWYNGEVLDTNKVTGIEAKLADKTINWLQGKDEEGLPDTTTGISTLIVQLTLQDIMDTDNTILENLANTPIGNLTTEINTLELGTLLGYERGDGTTLDNNDTTTDTQRWYKVEGNAYTAVSALENKLYDKSINQLQDDGIMSIVNETLFGEVMGYTYDNESCDNSDPAHEHTADCYTWYDDEGNAISGLESKMYGYTITSLQGSGMATLIDSLTLGDIVDVTEGSVLAIIGEDTKIGEIETKLNDIQLGLLLGYTLDNDCWYNGEVLDTNKVTGIEAKLANETLSTLKSGSMSTMINNLTLADVLTDEQRTGVLASIDPTTPITNISNAIDGMHLGTMLGYTKGDGTVGEIDVWYTDIDPLTEATGVTSKLAGLTISQLKDGDTLNSTVNGMTLGSLVDINDNSSPLLRSLASTPLNGLTAQIDSTELGTIQGLTKGDGTDGTEDGVWYSNTDGTLVKANALTQKISNLTVSSMTPGTIVTIVNGLTIQEMMDSGILTFDTATQVRLDNIFSANALLGQDVVDWRELQLTEFLSTLIGFLPTT